MNVVKSPNTRAAIWLYIFLLALVADLVLIWLNQPDLRLFTKPVLMLTLAGYFANSVMYIASPLKKWILMALLLSWAGDLFLLFESSNAQFFIWGLASFLLAHLCYILFFHIIRMKEAVKPRPLFLVAVAAYYFALIYLLSPYLKDLAIPVRVYAVVISFMYMLAMHLVYIRNGKAGLLMMVGALLFVVSDSVLAINRFYASFVGADTLVMLTYGFAQLLIVEGAIRFIRTDSH